jgi:hypothetical protein
MYSWNYVVLVCYLTFIDKPVKIDNNVSNSGYDNLFRLTYTDSNLRHPYISRLYTFPEFW